MSRRLRFWLTLSCGIVAAILVLVCPYETTAVPEWKIRVVSSRGDPLPCVEVHEEWINPIEDGIISVEGKTTDTEGWVLFPHRQTHTRLAIRMTDYLTRGSSLPRGKRYLPSAHAFVCWQDQTGELDWEPWDKTLGHLLVLHRGSCPYG